MSKKTHAIILGGLILQMAAGTALYFRQLSPVAAFLIIIPSHYLICLGCMDLAKEKGWHGLFGLFFGLFGIIGYLGLRSVADRPQLKKPDED